jgi:Tol biopolymer transport system component
VAFVSTRDGLRDLSLVEVSSGRVARLTTGLDVWPRPAWSPDGPFILVSSAATGVHEVYVVERDRGAVTRLTTGWEGTRP